MHIRPAHGLGTVVDVVEVDAVVEEVVDELDDVDDVDASVDEVVLVWASALCASHSAKTANAAAAVRRFMGRLLP